MKLTTKTIILLAAIVTFQIGLTSALLLAHQESVETAAQIERSLRRTSQGATVLYEIIHLRQAVTAGQLLPAQVKQEVALTLSAINKLGEEFDTSDPIQNTLKKASDAVRECQNWVHTTRAPGEFTENKDKAMWKNLTRIANNTLSTTGELSVRLSSEQSSTKETLLKLETLRQSATQILIAGIMGELAIIIVAFLWFRSTIQTRMRSVLANVDNLANSLPLEGPLKGQDELAYLDRTFHQLAEAILSTNNNERQLLDSQRDVICLLDEKLTVLKANRATTALLGASPQQLRHQKVTDLLSPDSKRTADEQLTMTRQRPTNHFETRMVARDGSMRDVRWSVKWSEPENYFFCVLHDIAAQKQAERLQQEVTQMVVHDVRTPLMTVTGTLQLFETGMLGTVTPAVQARIDDALESGNQLSSLITNMLDLEKIRASMFDLKIEELALQALFEEARTQTIERVKSIPGASRVSIEIRDTAARVRVDRTRMTRLLELLLTYSVKRFSRAGAENVRQDNKQAQQTISISAGLTKESLEISLVDNGPPVAKKDDIGLDFAWCQAIAELHQGQLLLDKDSPSGFASTIRLPRTVLVAG